jgi:UPF0042 nucleotide-binding protein
VTTVARATQVVVVTGLSGAGKSTALAALEDLGFHAIENVPPAVITQAIEACEGAGVKDIALGFGGSVGAFLDGAPDVLASVERGGHRKVTIVFLDASDDVVARRFNETRRPHPEAQRTKAAHLAGVLESVALERERLGPLRAMATLVIDTSALRVHDLRKRIFTLLKPDHDDLHRMQVRVMSFGFKVGLPHDADLVFDVRFIDNPHFVPELRPLTGEDPPVRDYVLAAEGTRQLLDKLGDLLAFLVPRYEEEGKSYVTVAIGCTGGQHRSVAIANAVAESLRVELARRAATTEVVVFHRDARPHVSRRDAGHRDPPEGGARAQVGA